MRLLAAALCLIVAFLSTGCDSADDQDAETVANNDSAQTSPGEAVTINVLANDRGSDLTIDSFQDRTRSGGTVSKTESDALSYRPGPGFLGADSFTYTARNGDGVTSKNATVTVTVQ
ncbi:Ig-like domain-containing protein [Rubrivirga sp.]|uniref:Ig-like domain-containing protein n=1 Tax=Rubrivirga sp. TaxID=1885344 RepID=UPI003B52FE3D